MKGMKHKGDDWATPLWLLELLCPNGYFDPCPLGGKDRHVDGLTAAWPTDRIVYVNPPYSDPTPWTARAAAHPGAVTMLLPHDESTEWWQRYARQFRVTPIGQRIRFVGAHTTARFPVAIWRRFA